jgi:hypothetical protein
MAWYWPKVEDAKTAQTAALEAVGAGLFVTGVTGVAAALSIVYRRPILGIDGGALFDASLFALVSWRVYKMSRTWAVLGLLLYLFEVAWRIAKQVGSSDATFGTGFSPVALILILAFVNGIRGTFAFRRFSRQFAGAGVSPSSTAIEDQTSAGLASKACPEITPPTNERTMKSKLTAVSLFAIALLLWVATISHDVLGFVAPVSAEALGADLWVSLMWLLFLYASRRLYLTFWKKNSSSTQYVSAKGVIE